MGFIRDMGDDNLLVEVNFYNVTSTMTNGVVTHTYSEDPDLTVDVLFWIGAAAERQVSDKYKSDVAGLVTMDYEDYTVTINENAKVTINGIDYSVIYVENKANQNVIIQIPVKRF